jgi:hypothetical protein
VLLVLGALHLTNFAIFRRIRRRPAPAAPRAGAGRGTARATAAPRPPAGARAA